MLLNDPTYQFTPMQAQAILRFASRVIAREVGAEVSFAEDEHLNSVANLKVGGAFTTLKKQGRLRACYGTFGGESSLRTAVENAAINTATRDHRFPPISPTELSELTLDVTLLFNFESVNVAIDDRPRQFEIGRHGIVLSLGHARGLFLPQVPVEQKWNQLEYLAHIGLKAGLSQDAWRHPDAKLTRFEGQILEGPFDTSEFTVAGTAPKPITVRNPAVAGQFYPGEPAKLEQLVAQCLAGPTNVEHDYPAIMAPHAGLVYSGKVAGAVFRQTRIPNRVLIIGPKHTPHGSDVAIMPFAKWRIPGIELENDENLNQALAKMPLARLDAAAHANEHAIELELPFIAAKNPRAKVCGLVIGRATLNQCLAIGDHLAHVVASSQEPILVVISTDMNHFATDQENRRLDAIALKAIESLDPSQVFRTVVEEYGISMCGVRPTVAVMQMLKRLGKLNKVSLVSYATSCDVNQNASRVVGYASMAFE